MCNLGGAQQELRGGSLAYVSTTRAGAAEAPRASLSLCLLTMWSLQHGGRRAARILPLASQTLKERVMGDRELGKRHTVALLLSSAGCRNYKGPPTFKGREAGSSSWY